MHRPGFPELLIMLVICLLLVGPRWLPLVGRDLGQTIREARQAARDQGYSPVLITLLIVLFVLSFVYGLINTFRIFN
jgi:TatA/E family protein of Tat protein translocase